MFAMYLGIISWLSDDETCFPSRFQLWEGYFCRIAIL